MGYTLIYTDNALEDIDWLKKSGDKACLKKLAKLLEELIEHPFTGTGQPEQLKFDFSGCWSRRINKKHRLIYQVEEKRVTVTLLSVYGHLGD